MTASPRTSSSGRRSRGSGRRCETRVTIGRDGCCGSIGARSSTTIGAKKEVLDQQIDDEINKAEKEIEVLRFSAPDKINKIAIETSSELLEKLIGSGVNSSSISAIVDDLSRRNGDKYYGN